MRKIALMTTVLLLSFCSYGQLALEGFETPWTGTPAAPPGGWVVLNEVGSITWVQSTAGSTVQQPVYEGSHAAYLQREDVNPGAPIPSNWLITKQFNAPLNGELHFFSRLTQLNDQGGIYKTMIALAPDSTTPAQDLTWVDLQTWTELTLNPSQTTYTEKIVGIPAVYTNQQIRIAFIMKGDNKDRWLIDNVEVYTRCVAPSSVKVTDIALNSAKINWVSANGVNSWDIEIVKSSEVPTGVGITYNGTLPYLKNGLEEDTEYKFYIRSNCAGNSKSGWVGPFFFSTLITGENCTVPIIIPSALPYSTNNNTANFSDVFESKSGTSCNGVDDYLAGNDVVYNYTPTVNGTIQISLSNTGNPAGVYVYNNCANIGVSCINGVAATATAAGVIPSLAVTAGTTYYIVVSTDGTTQVTPYTLTLQQVNCTAPTALTATALTASSANLSWAPGTASSWQAAIQQAGTGLPTGAGQTINTTTGYTATQTTNGDVFTPATNYEYYVRANCGNGTFSTWTGPYVFSTTQIPVALNYSQNFDGSASHGWSLNNGTQPNKWYVGVATSNSPSKSLYISNDNGISNNYTINIASTVHAYRDIQIPAGVKQISVSFDLKVAGEKSNDYVKVWLVPTNFIPTPGTMITPANSGGIQVGVNYNLFPNWTNQIAVANATAYAGSVGRLIFEWRNNAFTGTQDAAAIDNINISVVTCPAPTALVLGTTTTTSANFSWTTLAGTSPIGYEYYYTTNTLTVPTAATAPLGSSTTTNTSISSLTSGETYYVWVRSNCGTTDKSYWTGPTSVTLPQVPANLNYSENFDSGVHNFSLINGTQTNKWVVGSATSSSSSKSLYISNDNGITNSYDINNTSTVHAYRDILIPATAGEITVSFDYKTVGNSGDYFKVWMVPTTYNPTPGSQTFSGTDRVQLGGVFTQTNTWTTATFNTPVTAYKNKVRRLLIEWRNDASEGIQSPAAIDNINIIVTECPKPQNLTAANVSNTAVTLAWTEVGSASNWEIAISPVTDAAPPTPPAGAGTAVTGTSEYTPSSGTLIHNITYAYYVRSNCNGSAGSSQWAGPFKFALKPVNDECANSLTVLTNPTLVCTQNVEGNITGATASAGTTTCTGTKDDDIWFDFIATSTTHIINLNTITGSTNLLRGTIYSGNDCSTLTQIGCTTNNSTFIHNLVVGQPYKYRVWTSTSTPGQTTAFQLCITTPPAPPLNDDCASAFPVTVNPTFVCTQTTSGTVLSATASPETNTCSDGTDDDVWFSFIATNTSHKINLLNVTGDYNKLSHSVYSGDQCGTMTEISCNEYNNESWADNLIIGHTYKIRVYTGTDQPDQTSTFDICVTTPPAPAVNDNCAQAIVVPVNPTMVCTQSAPGTIESATPSPESNTCDVAANEDVWYQFTATSTIHNIELKDIKGSTNNLFHVVYSGSQCGTMTQLYCSDANYSVAAGLTIGQVYKVRVYTNEDEIHQTSKFNICVSTPLPPAVNDDCANAILVPVNADSSCNLVTSGNVFGATASTEPNECDNGDDDDIWFEFVAVDTVHIITLMNIHGSADNLDHAVYSGDQCGALVQLNCSDINSSTVGGLIVGNTYKIRVYTQTEEPNQTTTFDLCIKSKNSSIAVNPNTYTTEQLVKEVLINSECALVSNITAKSGIDYGTTPSIGYFDANGADFPFDYGVVLSTANVNYAKLPYTSTTPDEDSNFWLGDSQLNNIILADNPAKDKGTYNATMLEFDFVPLTNTFKFNFLFASNEYGEYQCGFTDAFAFILTDQNGVSQNLAVLPNTTIPVSVNTIRDGQNWPDCESENAEYFGQYNEDAILGAAINFRGQTTPLVAKATVNPGEIYHIKMVIADYWDSNFMSAVFLDGGSFDIGELDLGGDLLVENGTALCDSQSAILDTELVGPNYIITWYKDGVVIPDATATTYEVTESGTYGVKATFADVACSYEGSVIVEIYPPVEEITGNPVNLTLCDASGTAQFDLTPSVDAILAGTTQPADFVNSIHRSEAEARSGDNPIADITAYTNETAGVQTLWVRTGYTVSGCIGVKSFNLVVQDLTPHFTITPDFSMCEGTTKAIETTASNYDPLTVTYIWTFNGNPLPDTTSAINAAETGIYVVVINNSGCTSTATVNVTVLPVPVADAPIDVIACDSYKLPALTSGNYFTETNGTGTALFAGQDITQITTVYVFADNGVCADENVFKVTITPTPVFSLGDTQTVCVASNAIINVTPSNFNVNDATYVWTFKGKPIEGKNSIVASEFGKYEVTVSIGDCSHTESVTVKQDITGIALIIADGCEDNKYMVGVTDDNNSFNIDTATYSWEGPQGFVSTERKFAVTKTGTYIITVTTPEGCVGEDFIEVTETNCNIQRGISPNGDGLNDNFDLTTLNVRKISIFNRYGQEVYTKGNYKNEWQGQGNNGNELPTGTYFYMIELQNGDSNTGWIYINRQE